MGGETLALIPNGDVFLALDKKLRAGQMPGVENVGFFSRDGGHVRAGLPRYTLAATCYAVMFGAHPGRLDAVIYNDLDNYKNENLNKLPGKIGPGYVHWPISANCSISPPSGRRSSTTRSGKWSRAIPIRRSSSGIQKS